MRSVAAPPERLQASSAVESRPTSEADALPAGQPSFGVTLPAIGSPSALAKDYRHCGYHEGCDACVTRRTPDPSAFAT